MAWNTLQLFVNAFLSCGQTSRRIKSIGAAVEGTEVNNPLPGPLLELSKAKPSQSLTLRYLESLPHSASSSQIPQVRISVFVELKRPQSGETLPGGRGCGNYAQEMAIERQTTVVTPELVKVPIYFGGGFPHASAVSPLDRLFSCRTSIRKRSGAFWRGAPTCPIPCH